MYRERIGKLMEACKADENDLDFIESRVNKLVDYVSYVSFMETRIQRLSIEGINGEEWREKVQALDENRRSKHEVAMAAVTQLNRLSIAEGLESFYDGPVDHEHRNEVGDLCQAVCSEYFEGRHLQPLKMTDLTQKSESDILLTNADLNGLEHNNTLEV